MKKKFDFPEKFDITLSTASGVESVTKKELIRLGYEPAPAINGRLTISGGKLDVARLNMFMRTADRVYIRVKEFPCDNFDMLFDRIKAIRWEDFITENAQILVDGKCVKSKLFAISACQGIVKKAIVERLKFAYKTNTLNEDGATYRVEFSIFKDVCEVFINTSGDGLHKRGYRDMVGIAPIKETLASALLLMSDFYYNRPLYDPFCGSGTMLIEGAKIALNIASGKNRKFAFNYWQNFEREYYNLAKEQALDLEKLDRKIEFFGTDIDKKAISLSLHHAERAGLKGRINFKVCPVGKTDLPKEYGTIVSNPPYGERVYDKKQAEECYKDLGALVKNNPYWSTFIITSANNFEKCFGKKADRNKKLYNSNKECRYYFYYAKEKKRDIIE